MMCKYCSYPGLQLPKVLALYCMHCSPQDLVKELIHTKQRLCNSEEELKAVRNYLDNLLLRIMETNPSLLSST